MQIVSCPVNCKVPIYKEKRSYWWIQLDFLIESLSCNAQYLLRRMHVFSGI